MRPAINPPQGGILTFLFIDFENSAQLWDSHPLEMQTAVAGLVETIRPSLEGNGGYVFRVVGEAFFAVFESPSMAITAAVEIQSTLVAYSPFDLKARMALHTGQVEERDGEYFGPVLNRVARLLASAHGHQIVVSSVAADLARDNLPEEISLISLGEYRLKDVIRAERVYQVVAAGLPEQFPPLKTTGCEPGYLPMQLTSFIGRENEIEQVKELLQDSRLVTLTGTEGVGKTHLSLQVAEELRDNYPEGVWQIELAPLTDPDCIEQAIIEVLQGQESRRIHRSLVEYLGSRQLLLVLDNCEHLVDACARLVKDILLNCPQVQIIATSRETLNIPGETNFPVLPLPVPAENAGCAVADFDSIRLFLERARAVQQNFSLSDHNAAQVARICRLLEGNPLAIELAAARVRVLSLDQIAARLENSFNQPTEISREIKPEPAMVNWSYVILASQEVDKVLAEQSAMPDWPDNVAQLATRSSYLVCYNSFTGEVIESDDELTIWIDYQYSRNWHYQGEYLVKNFNFLPDNSARIELLGANRQGYALGPPVDTVLAEQIVVYITCFFRRQIVSSGIGFWFTWRDRSEPEYERRYKYYCNKTAPAV